LSFEISLIIFIENCKEKLYYKSYIIYKQYIDHLSFTNSKVNVTKGLPLRKAKYRPLLTKIIKGNKEVEEICYNSYNNEDEALLKMIMIIQGQLCDHDTDDDDYVDDIGNAVK
jgi:hypothetical protein